MLVVDGRQLTIFAGIEVDYIANPDIDNPQESLILLLELLLVENLNRENAVLVDSPTAMTPVNTNMFLYHIHAAGNPSRITYKSNGSFQ